VQAFDLVWHGLTTSDDCRTGISRMHSW